MTRSLADMRSAVHRAVHGRIDRRFRARFDTSDVAQEVALSAWLNLQETAEPPNESWLRVVTERYAAKLHTFHSAQRRSVHVEQTSQSEASCAHQRAPEEVITREQVEYLFAAMVRLPHADRRMLHLRFVENHSLKAIARQLNQPEHRVRRQFHQVLNQLRGELGGRNVAPVPECRP